MKSVNFPELKKVCKHDCGAFALETVFSFYGEKISEEEILKITQTKPKTSTSVKSMLVAIKHFRFKGELKKLDIQTLRKYIDKKCPVILKLQTWSQHKNTEWSKFWKDSHYVIAVAYDKDKFYFQDPWTINKTFLTNNDLMSRWQDKDENGKVYLNNGIVMMGKRKALDQTLEKSKK